MRVEVSPDASYAKVFVSALSGIEEAKEAVKGLTAATGLVRREVGNRLHLRKAPEIKFVADDSVEQGVRLFEKLERTKRGSHDED